MHMNLIIVIKNNGNVDVVVLKTMLILENYRINNKESFVISILFLLYLTLLNFYYLTSPII